MWVASRVGEGSTFHFTIASQRVGGIKSPCSHSGTASLTGKAILIVDDKAINRTILRIQTESFGLHPRLAANGDEALTLLGSHGFDLAILDMHMPGMNGLELARRIRENGKTRSLPLLLLTSIADSLGRLQDLPLANALAKPARLQTLRDALLQALKGAGKIDQRPKSGSFRDLAAVHPLRILLAEDNLVNQRIATLMLEKFGYLAETVSNGAEALEAALRQPYDLILMDVQMPVMDGTEATDRIRKAPGINLQPRIVAMTANATVEDKRMCLESGMDDHLAKPVRPKDLEAAILRCKDASIESQVLLLAHAPGDPPLGSDARYPVRRPDGRPNSRCALRGGEGFGVTAGSGTAGTVPERFMGGEQERVE